MKVETLTHFAPRLAACFVAAGCALALAQPAGAAEPAKPAATTAAKATTAKAKPAAAKPKAPAAAKAKAVVPAKAPAAKAVAAKPAAAKPAAAVAPARPAAPAPQPAAAVVPPARSAGSADGFMNAFAARAMATFNDKRAPTARRADLETLMRDSFDFRSIGQFVLARHWDSATPEQQAQFESAFTDFSIANYAKQIAAFQITRMTVQASRPAPDGPDTIVDTAIERQGQKPAVFGWRVHQAGGQQRLVDVFVDGVSLATTQRSDMTAFVNRKGLDALIDHMRQQVASAR